MLRVGTLVSLVDDLVACDDSGVLIVLGSERKEVEIPPSADRSTVFYINSIRKNELEVVHIDAIDKLFVYLGKLEYDYLAQQQIFKNLGIYGLFEEYKNEQWRLELIMSKIQQIKTCFSHVFMVEMNQNTVEMSSSVIQRWIR